MSFFDSNLQSNYRKRFGVVYLLLVALAAVSGLMLVKVMGSEYQPPTRSNKIWSSWEPSREGAAGARQIAEQVSSNYRGYRGEDLVDIRASELFYKGKKVAIGFPDTQKANQVSLIKDTVLLYQLCGAGKNCSIKGGKPSTKRHALLRREAYELALYSFKYLDYAGVVVILPPLPDAEASQMVIFNRKSLEKELSSPLSLTLPDRNYSPSAFPASEAKRIDEKTRTWLYAFKLQNLKTTSGEIQPTLLVNPISTVEQGSVSPTVRVELTHTKAQGQKSFSLNCPNSDAIQTASCLSVVKLIEIPKAELKKVLKGCNDRAEPQNYKAVGEVSGKQINLTFNNSCLKKFRTLEVVFRPLIEEE